MKNAYRYGTTKYIHELSKKLLPNVVFEAGKGLQRASMDHNTKFKISYMNKYSKRNVAVRKFSKIAESDYQMKRYMKYKTSRN